MPLGVTVSLGSDIPALPIPLLSQGDGVLSAENSVLQKAGNQTKSPPCYREPGKQRTASTQ